MNNYELYHHGILGQKWGIRRFQNRDGTYTSAGKRRRNDGLEGTVTPQRSSSGVGKNIAKGLAIGAAAGLTAYALANPQSREFLKKVASTSVSKLKSAATDPKVKEFIKENGTKAVKAIGNKTKEVGKAATDAAIASMGTIAVAKFASKMQVPEDADQSTKDLNKVLLDAGTAAINAATNPSGNKSTSGNKSGPISREKGAEISKLVGAPKQKEIDRSGPEYQALFKNKSGNNRDVNERAIIKSMASAGYGIDQIEQYLTALDNGSIKHGDFMNNYMFEYELYHHGIKGQRWGVRRFQNADGSLKAAGKKRYGDDSGSNNKPSGSKGGSSAPKKEKGAGLKKAGSFLKKAAKLAASASVEVSNKYGKFKLNDFSNDAEEEGKDAVKAWSSSDGIMNVYANNVYVNNNTRESSEERAARERKEKYDALPDEVKKDRDVGKPSGKPIDKNSKEYQDLFKDDSPMNESGTRNPKTRKLIKDMADAGYDADQIRKKLNKIDWDDDSPYNESKYKSDQYWDKADKERDSFWDDDD